MNVNIVADINARRIRAVQCMDDCGRAMVNCESCGAEYNSSIAANRCCTDHQRPWDDERNWG